ncbi:hypothetical protein HOLleu_15346 [Holothuria leucospilota]|uniref:Uncharacterized protein n=1 Tax=Holothuria leucospilota TaxID=206669 RepID=A0A9Q1HD41_HOLLE|nr:hypothetical protein HOLleu_15346 [Holothuria leucospilota]
MVAQKEVKGNPLLGVNLCLDPSIKDRYLKKYVKLNYSDRQKPSNPKVDHSGYKLYTLKNVGKIYGQINAIWLLMCSWLVSQFTGNEASGQESGDVNSIAEVVVTSVNDDKAGTEVERSQSITEEAKVEGSQSIVEEAEVEGSQSVAEEAEMEESESIAEEAGVEGSQSVAKEEEMEESQSVGVEVDTPMIEDGANNMSRENKTKKSAVTCPTWSTYHSLLNRSNGVWNVGICAPLYRRSPTEWPVLLTILMQAQKINTLIVGEVFQETGIPNLASDIKGAVDAFGSYLNSSDSELFEQQIEAINQQLGSTDVFKRITDWKAQSTGIQKFLTNYMTQVQALLMFIAATRKADWKLHLATTEDLLPYFHAHDQYNYGRWGPLYVADMLELQTTDPELWKFFEEGNFIITKHEIPFTGIDPDHAIEQEHRKIKAKGGFVGLTGNEAALAKYAIIAPSLARIVQEFKEYAGIQGRQPSTLHHETVGEKSTQMIKYAADVVDVITKQGNPFMQSDMFNLVTYAVTPAKVAKNIEDRDNLGREALEKFVSSRMIEHTTGFWDSQKKNNITFFKDVGPVAKAKMKGQLVTVKQERRLLSQLLVVAKSRPEFVVKDTIGEYEFSNTPPSNFYPDGSMIILSGKSQTVRLIMDLPLPDNVQEPTSEDST